MIYTAQHREAARRIARWRRDPIAFVREAFGVTPDLWQQEVLRDYGDPARRYIAMQACAGVGKTAVLAWIGWHFLLCHGDKDNHPNGLATAIDGANLKDNLWKELAVWRNRSLMLQEMFEWTKERIFAKSAPATWWLSARTYSKNADEQAQGRTLSGLHAKYILYLLDESGDISPAILRAAEQGLGNCAWGKIVQSGNPTSVTGSLYYATATQAKKWSVTRITADPDAPNRSPRVDKQWAADQIAEHGRENAWVMAFILGKFPTTALNTLLSPDEVRDAMDRHLTADQYNFSQKRIGIDVARFGDDRTVLFPRQGLAALTPVEMRGARTTAIAARVLLAVDRWKSELEIIDDTGHWGHGVIDNLHASGRSPIGIQFHGPPLDSRYKNRRVEMWLRMAEWVKRGGSLPRVPALVGELTMPTYWFQNGKFHLEDKEQLKKRLGRSPDLADALALTFAVPDAPTEAYLPAALKGRAAKLHWDYDPLNHTPHER